MKVALVGNPNAGKSTLFNQLTGLKQKAGNFPGVTVDKKYGKTSLSKDVKAEVIDLPGTYSLYPKSLDESIVLETLLKPASDLRPDLVLVVVDASNLKRNLLLFTQIKDLGLPCILILNQIDQAERRGVQIDVDKLAQRVQNPVIAMNARKGDKLKELKETMLQVLAQESKPSSHPYFLHPPNEHKEWIAEIKDFFKIDHDYRASQYLQQRSFLRFLEPQEHQYLEKIEQEVNFQPLAWQKEETLHRYEIIEDLLTELSSQSPNKTASSTWNDRLDAILTHRIGGYLIFFVLLLLVFQAIFAWATYPMDAIDFAFGSLQSLVQTNLPPGVFTDLLSEGLIAGIGGIVIFIPQIAILFFFISILEESGYMARVVYMMDRLMRPFGLNGKSVVPLISGVACAIPAIMATRNIDNTKERLITIFVTPLMSCSARLPVYAILIALVIPNQTYLGIFHLQGLVLLGLYLLGFVMALLSAFLLKQIIKSPDQSYLIMELPNYQSPNWPNVGQTVWEKTRLFVTEAGKIILAISIVLWVLSSYGPSQAMQAAEQKAAQAQSENPELDYEQTLSSLQLEASYVGHLGKFIEPAIEPLGYDWKIGIALITSFAAREVFVGSIATIYSVGADEEDFTTIKQRLREEKNPETGGPRFTLAVGVSLLMFYAFAMQCMSTVAVVYRETKGWKWVIIQFLYLTGIAYLFSYLSYIFLS